MSLNGTGGKQTRIERREILRTSALRRAVSRKMRYAKREKKDGEEDGRTYGDEVTATSWRREEGEGTKRDRLAHAWRVSARAGQGLALENVKPTDSPIYRPPSEFALRAFRKTFATLANAEGRERRERGNRTETALRRGVPLPKHSRADGRMNALGRRIPSLSFPFLLFSSPVARFAADRKSARFAGTGERHEPREEKRDGEGERKRWRRRE